MTVKQLTDVLLQYPEGLQVETIFDCTNWKNDIIGFDLQYDEGMDEPSSVLLICSQTKKPNIIPERPKMKMKLNLSDWKKHWL